MSDGENGESSPKQINEEELKMKKANSYTYWVNNDPSFFGGKNYNYVAPSKVDEEVAKKIKE